MSLPPSSRPEVEAEQTGDVRLLGFDEDTSETVLAAISSETARTLLHQIHDEPGTPSELAERADTSVQNVSYHLEKLAAADLVQVAGTQLSAKGTEIDVYGPADEPLVVFVGTDERRTSLVDLLEGLVEKGRKDDRTNEYTLIDRGRRELEARRDREQQAAESQLRAAAA